MRGESRLVYEREHVHVDGHKTAFTATALPYRGVDGSVEGIIASFGDISELKNREKALRESEEKSRAQFQSIPVPTYVWQWVDNDFVFIDYNEEVNYGDFSWDPKPATGTYAFVNGINGPSYGASHLRVKHFNTGPFLYLESVELREITDGLSHTNFVGEVRLAHNIHNRNLWTYGLRHLDSMRTTEWPLNGPIAVRPPGWQ